MISIKPTFSPYSAWQQLKQEQAYLRQAHHHAWCARTPLRADARDVWRRDHFVASAAHYAHDALHQAQLGAVYVKKPITYVVGVLAEVAFFGALVVVGLGFAAIGELVAWVARQDVSRGASHHFHLAVDVCLFGVYTPMKLCEQLVDQVIDATVVAGAVPVGAATGACLYVLGRQTYLHPAEALRRPGASEPAAESRAEPLAPASDTDHLNVPAGTRIERAVRRA